MCYTYDKSKGGDTRELQSRMVPPPKKLGRVTLMLINVGITPHVLVKSDFCEFIIHSGRLSVSTVLKSCFKTKFIRDMTRGWIEGQF